MIAKELLKIIMVNYLRHPTFLECPNAAQQHQRHNSGSPREFPNNKINHNLYESILTNFTGNFKMKTLCWSVTMTASKMADPTFNRTYSTMDALQYYFDSTTISPSYLVQNETLVYQKVRLKSRQQGLI